MKSFSHCSSRWCSAVGIFWRAEDEHLDLVEPVHAKDASGVLAVGAGLPPIARAQADVAARQRVRIEDLVGVVGRERDLRGADQVEIILLEMVDVLRGLAEKPVPSIACGLTSDGRDERDEAVRDGGAHCEVDQGQFKLRALPGQVVEAGPGDLGAAFHVDCAEQLAELQMIFGTEALCGEVRGVPRVSTTA